MATYAAFKHVELHKVGYGKNRVPNAPRSCISEIFMESGGKKNGTVKLQNGRERRVQRDTPTRPRDTHSRLFGQPAKKQTPPMVTNTIRSNIHFGSHDDRAFSSSPPSSKASSVINGRSGANTPTREGNPITGDGYKSLNGEINTAVTALNSNYQPILHNCIPPGGFSSGLW